MENSITTSVSVISSIIAAISAAVSVYLAIKKSRPEIRKMNADANGITVNGASKVVSMASDYASMVTRELQSTREKLEKMQGRVDVLEDKLHTFIELLGQVRVRIANIRNMQDILSQIDKALEICRKDDIT